MATCGIPFLQHRCADDVLNKIRYACTDKRKNSVNSIDYMVCQRPELH